MVELGVVEAVEQVDRAGPRGGEADADLARVLRVRAGHERRHLLVADLHELQQPVRIDRAAGAVQRAHDPVDPVARIAIDPADAVGGEAVEQVAADGLAHAGSSPRPRRDLTPWRRPRSSFCQLMRSYAALVAIT